MLIDEELKIDKEVSIGEKEGEKGWEKREKKEKVEIVYKFGLQLEGLS